ncbi:MAG: translocation/assembly module TamB [Muribaculaceae bacterium]|nr:translocation/assembly module TamB [Muribaculaceae bacterium]
MIRLAWKIFRAVVSVLLLLAVLLPVSLYMLLSVDGVQQRIRTIAVTELSRTLGADVGIGNVTIHPFSTLTVKDLSLSLEGDTIARVATVSAGFELYHLLRTGELVIDYALVDDASFAISRPAPGAMLNIEPIIAHLRSDKPSREKAFELKINTVALRNAALSYDVLSEAAPDSARFDPNHIAVSELSLNAFIPRISNRLYRAHIDHLSFVERSGFVLKSLRGKADFGRSGAALSDFCMELPHSRMALAPLALSFDGYSDIVPSLSRNELHLSTSGANFIYPPDLAAFAPALADIDKAFAIDIDARGNKQAAELRNFAVRSLDPGLLSLTLTGSARGLANPDSLSYSIARGAVLIDGTEAAAILGGKLPKDVRATLSRLPELTCAFSAKGTLSQGSADITAEGTPGALSADLAYSRATGKTVSVRGDISMDGLDLGLLSGIADLGVADGSISGKVSTGRGVTADISAALDRLEFRGYAYSGIKADLDVLHSKRVEANLAIDDPAGRLMTYAFYESTSGQHSIRATATASGIDLHTLGLDSKHPGHKFGVKANIELEGSNIDDIAGTVSIFDLRWLDEAGQGLRLNRLALHADPRAEDPILTLNSDIARGTVKGQYSFTSLVPQLKAQVGSFLPALVEPEQPDSRKKQPSSKAGSKPSAPNDFDFSFTLLPSQQVSSFLGLPVHVITDIDISGHIDSRRGRSSLSIDAPYLVQGNKLLEKSSLYVGIDSAMHSATVLTATQMPTKKGDMTVNATLRCADNRIDTHVDWAIARAIPLNGTIDFSTLLRARPGKGLGGTFPLDARIDFNPGTINFGDEVWNIAGSTVDIAPERLEVSGFGLVADSQRIAIDGTVGTEPADSLAIKLDDIALVPIFETLEIDKALIGGRATGTFTARNLLGAEPDISCPLLHVDSIGYQYCTIGDADILAKWSNERKAVFLDADITGLEGRKSRIYGDILPFGEALDLNFEADSIPVGFLRPFMSAFASSVSGRASGKCRLFGTFKEIDLEGDVKADNVTLKIDFTGTSYTASDSVHIAPGLIELRDLTIRDAEGHTAKLNGRVDHRFFKEPTFRFDITRAHNLLCYNTTARDNPDWYGTIYGNGSASISGEPGVVNIGVDMTTAPRSTFDFVLSDRLDAEEYSFITFRDRTPDSLKVMQHVDVDTTPAAVKAFRRQAAGSADSPSKYNMDIRVGLTPDATVTLVMDAASGDRIRAHGDGNLHLAYKSANNDLNIWGKYTVADGSYRFTLQDIIIKDFIISEGSEIQFDGDPYGVKTNLRAYYATNANLSDLDESFLQDKDVARTNVPVHALMKVSGDIRQPAIDFDLEFPTLTSDTYRKVRSIVSTEDMMNRQIIYLLTLNRFYTPDYMASTTKGSELFSVASSTISSQLGNMLGKLSDKWSIAPNLRSDRGDFSDVEVDVALSSRLLNNRLIFNGNFGYRDRSLNSNQFIGDFDIEYLLNKRGTWRLKAYNRYNDRNYYLRSAQTTQGIGIMFRRDFDSFLSFLRKFRNK